MSITNRFSITFETTSGCLTLEYEVNSHSFAQKWFSLFKQETVSNLRTRQNTFSFFDMTDAELQPHIEKLNGLVDSLNEWVDIKIEGKFEPDDHQASINRLHVHFPHLERIETDNQRLTQLADYNDVIHYLEGAYRTRKMKAEDNYSMARMLLCFNGRQTLPIDPDEYRYFDITRRFGDVVCHYPHVGRHPMEVFFAKDMDVPVEQIIPQSRIASDASFNFGSNSRSCDPAVKQRILGELDTFFRQYGEDKLPYRIRDPRFAVGYVQVARLLGGDYELDTLGSEPYRQKLKTAELISINF
jgi:hypothetical protein